jgi:hypothetical protein
VATAPRDWTLLAERTPPSVVPITKGSTRPLRPPVQPSAGLVFCPIDPPSCDRLPYQSSAGHARAAP